MIEVYSVYHESDHVNGYSMDVTKYSSESPRTEIEKLHIKYADMQGIMPGVFLGGVLKASGTEWSSMNFLAPILYFKDAATDPIAFETSLIHTTMVWPLPPNSSPRKFEYFPISCLAYPNNIFAR